MPLGLLVILGVGAYLYHQRKNAPPAALSDPDAIAQGWSLLSAWSQSQSGKSVGRQPTSVSDPGFTALTRQFQAWAAGKGYVYQPRSGQPRALLTDGVLDAPTLAVLDAHVGSTAWQGTQTFTTGGYYYLSFVRGAAGLDQWSLSSEVDAPPAPDGVIGPAAWLAQLASGQAIAIGCWLGPQYGADDRVTSFGPARAPEAGPAAWREITSRRGQEAQPGTYRISYDAVSTPADSAVAAAAKMSADVGFELQGRPPTPTAGGPWPVDDVGSDMPSGSRGAGMMPASPLPRVRMQWSVSKPTPWPTPKGASRVRVWQQADSSDVVSYKAVAITVRDEGPRADPQKRWEALAAVADAAGISKFTGPTRHAVLSKAQAAVDVASGGMDP